MIEKFLKNRGIARTKNQANFIMIIVIMLCFVIIVVNINRGKRPSQQNSLTENEILELEQMSNSSIPADIY